MYMLNYRFEVLHFNAEVGQFFNTALDQIDSEKVVVVPDFDRPISLSDDFIFNNVDPIEQPFFVSSYSHGDLTLIYDPSKPCFAIRNNEKKYMSFSDGKYSFSRDEYKMWEYFWVFDEKLIEKIEYVKSNSWISKRTSRAYGPSEISIGEDFNTFIGKFSLDVRCQNLNDFGQYEILGVVDNWAPETFLLYNPAVYITAYTRIH